MAGIFIYKNYLNHHDSFAASNNEIYKEIRDKYLIYGRQILWEKVDTTLDKIESARKTKDNLVARLNIGEKINFEELNLFFR